MLHFIAATASEPEANERCSSLISRRLHYRGLQSLFLNKRKELWLCANGRFRMRCGMRKDCGYARMVGLACAVVCARNCGYARMEDLGCAVVCARNCGYARKEDLGCPVVCRKELWLCLNGKNWDAQHIKVTFNKKSRNLICTTSSN